MFRIVGFAVSLSTVVSGSASFPLVGVSKVTASGYAVSFDWSTADFIIINENFDFWLQGAGSGLECVVQARRDQAFEVTLRGVDYGPFDYYEVDIASSTDTKMKQTIDNTSCNQVEVAKNCDLLPHFVGFESPQSITKVDTEDCPGPLVKGKCDRWNGTSIRGCPQEFHFQVGTSKLVQFFAASCIDDPFRFNTTLHFTVWDVDSDIDDSTFSIPDEWQPCQEDVSSENVPLVVSAHTCQPLWPYGVRQILGKNSAIV